MALSVLEQTDQELEKLHSVRVKRRAGAVRRRGGGAVSQSAVSQSAVSQSAVSQSAVSRPPAAAGRPATTGVRCRRGE
jgi:hypothetical protein